ncbi:MAG TPA: ankyrin repeat domain-containing protein [Archangium sp.]|nr:ankyrin repeat domain-containing protein [Archangium sp.]
MMSKQEGAPTISGWGTALALMLAVGVLGLTVSWPEVLRPRAARQLSLAVSRGDVAAADLWLLLVDPDRMAHSVLGEAARQGNTEMVRLLLERGADVNHRGKDGPTPFQLAARHGHLDVMRQLITAGADEDDGEALEGATRDCRPEAVKLLLGQGGWRRKTPLSPKTVERARRLAEAAGCEAVLRLLPSP